MTSACVTSPEPPSAAPTFPPDETPPPPPTTLIYVDRTTLKAYDLKTGAAEVIADLPSADVAVSPDGALYAVVEETDPRGSTHEGFRRPAIVIAGTSGTQAPDDLGPGRSPVWDPDSSALAAVLPAGRTESMAIYKLPGGPPVLTGDPETLWTIVGWHGDELIAIGARSGVVALPTVRSETRSPFTDEPRALGIQPSELWGVSPAGTQYVAIRGRGAVIEGEGAARRIDVDAALGDGTWSFDGATIGVVFIEGPATGLGLIDVATGQVRDVADGQRAQGNVVWALDGQTFAFVRVDPERRSRLEAMVCASSTECSSAFSWDEGIRLLAFR